MFVLGREGGEFLGEWSAGGYLDGDADAADEGAVGYWLLGEGEGAQVSFGVVEYGGFKDGGRIVEDWGFGDGWEVFGRGKEGGQVKFCGGVKRGR